MARNRYDFLLGKSPEKKTSVTKVPKITKKVKNADKSNKEAMTLESAFDIPERSNYRDYSISYDPNKYLSPDALAALIEIRQRKK